MTNAPERQPLSDELLRRVGRNVVNFQYLEATLRSMIPVLSRSGTIKQVQTQLASATRKHKKSTFGDLTVEYNNHVYRPAKARAEPSDQAPTEPISSFNLRIESTPESIAQQKRALRKLVDERNRLIHSDLLSVDLNSTDECDAMSAKLDEQNDRIRQQIDGLNSIRHRLLSGFEEWQRLVQSGEFLALLQGGQEDDS